MAKNSEAPEIECPTAVAVLKGKGVLKPMFISGCIGMRVNHYRIQGCLLGCLSKGRNRAGGGRLVEEVQRLEEDGYQVLLGGGWK